MRRRPTDASENDCLRAGDGLFLRLFEADRSRTLGPSPNHAVERKGPMTPREIFALIPPKLAFEILEYAHTEDREVYRTALQAVAQARKVRVVYLERQPRVQRHAGMVPLLSRPGLAAVADTLLRTWLLKKHNAVLTDFLDALKLKHEKGVVENLPATVDDAALQAAVDALLAKHPPQVASIYLHAFNHMNDAKWTNLEALLQKDARLTDSLLQET